MQIDVRVMSETCHYGIRQVSFQTFEVETSAGIVPCRSMMHQIEFDYLHELARNRHVGKGAVVDLGPYTGLSTYALASGLAKNKNEPARNTRISSFDLFLVYDWFSSGLDCERIGSVFPQYLRVNRNYLNRIDVFPGDALQMKWSGAAVETLFIDIAKSWDLNRWVLRQFFPHLIPGTSFVVQQDYVHFNEYLLHITMEHFADRFAVDEIIFAGTVGYRCVAPISAEEVAFDLSALPLTKKMNLLHRAYEKMPAPVRPVLLCAQAKCLFDHGELSEALRTLNAVCIDRLTDNPKLDCHEIAAGNREEVIRLIKAV